MPETGGGAMICSYATLDVDKLKTVQDLERKTGRTLLAFSCSDVGIAPLGDDELREIRAVEDRLCLQLVAVQ